MTSQAYIEALNQSTSTLESNARALVEAAVCQLRQQYREKFFEICIIHLSFLLDLPPDFYQMAAKLASKSDAILASSSSASQQKTTPKVSWNAITATPSKISVSSESHKEVLAFTTVKKLIRSLDDDRQLRLEGIFRKTGNVSRVKQLKEGLSLCDHRTPISVLEIDNAEYDYDCDYASAQPVSSTPCRGDTLSPQQFTVHDKVGVLKAFLADFTEPLVTHDLFNVFCDATGICFPRPDAKGQNTLPSSDDLALFDAKRKKAYRLLTLMLPLENRSILFNLLNLLQKTLLHIQENKMSAESLGTVFAPLIVSPRNMSASELSAEHKSRVIPTATKLIEENCDIFRIPLDLALDMAKHLKKIAECSRLPQSSCDLEENSAVTSCLLLTDKPPSTPSDLSRSSFIDSFTFQKTPNDAHDDVVDTCVSFAYAAETRTPASFANHSQVVAELFAHVEALPESKKKAKLLAKLNKFDNSSEVQKSCQEYLKKGTKRSRIACFIKKIGRQTDDREDKENSQSTFDRFKVDSTLKQASGTCTPIKGGSLEPAKLYALLVPPKMDKKTALQNYCLDDAWDHSNNCAWPVLHSTFVKHSNC